MSTYNKVLCVTSQTIGHKQRNAHAHDKRGRCLGFNQALSVARCVEANFTSTFLICLHNTCNADEQDSAEKRWKCGGGMQETPVSRKESTASLF